MKIELTLLLTLFVYSLKSQEMNVKVNDQAYVVKQYDEIRFQQRFLSIELEEKPSVAANRGVAKAYHSNEGDVVLEYFSKRYLHFSSIEEYERMKNVYFPTLIPYGYNHRISYYILIDENDFKELSRDLPKWNLPSGLSSMGDFYKLHDNRVLFRGEKYWAEGEFYILESLETLLAIDDELFPEIEKSTSLTGYDPASVETVEVPSYELEVINGVLKNAEDARGILSSILNIEEVNLDYSQSSLELMDKSLFENMNRIDTYELGALCISYVSECISRYFGDGSVVISSGEGGVLIKRNGKQSNIWLYVLQHVTDVDYGLAEFVPVYLGVLSDIR